ncbi:MAG: hypothetical protein P8Y44_12325, partial [Acidobacteriota bacterium]
CRHSLLQIDYRFRVLDSDPKNPNSCFRIWKTTGPRQSKVKPRLADKTTREATIEARNGRLLGFPEET